MSSYFLVFLNILTKKYMSWYKMYYIIMLYKEFNMADNKARDDKFINKKQKHEIKYEQGKYPKKYADIVKKEIEKGNYQTHTQLEQNLKNKGINKK